jgi:hypothetical protein
MFATDGCWPVEATPSLAGTDHSAHSTLPLQIGYPQLGFRCEIVLRKERRGDGLWRCGGEGKWGVSVLGPASEWMAA